MSSWATLAQTLVTLAAGGGLAEGGSWLRENRSRRNEERAARGRFQRETVGALQGKLEEWAADMAPYWAGGEPRPGVLISLGHIIVLTSRLENQELAEEVRVWTRRVREQVDEKGRPTGETLVELREEQFEVIGRLAAELSRWKP